MHRELLLQDQKYLLFGQNADADVPLPDQLPW